MIAMLPTASTWTKKVKCHLTALQECFSDKGNIFIAIFHDCYSKKLSLLYVILVVKYSVLFFNRRFDVQDSSRVQLTDNLL